MSLKLRPVTLSEANLFVAEHHRHHNPLRIHKFSIGCEKDGKLCGVAIVARPASRHLDDGKTLEVARLCTDGTHNACSKLYSAAWRAAEALGYEKIVTYILISENGASLRASGWRCMGEAGGPHWTGKREAGRHQGLLFDDGCKTPQVKKLRYEMYRDAIHRR
jgi:hypothetical protein